MDLFKKHEGWTRVWEMSVRSVLFQVSWNILGETENKKSYLKMAVAWPEPDMSLLIQTYENRWVLTKNNVKSGKNLKEFSLLWLLKDAKSW